MAKLITVYWRDIPAQVIAKQGRTTAKVPLSERFADAVDRAAMRAGKGSSDAYLNEWRRVATVCSGDLEQAAQQQAEKLEAAYSDELLTALIRNKGVATQSTDTEQPASTES